MVLIKIDRNNEIPVFKQITHQIIDLIENDALKAGDNLPATRILADRLGTDRSTVYRAYLELAALGYIESRPGSYTRVRKRAPVIKKGQVSPESVINWSERGNQESNEIFRYFQHFWPEKVPGIPENLINLSPLDLDERIFPAIEFRRCLNQVLVNVGPKLLKYGEYQGYLPLREDIARRMQVHGISISAEEILITNGAQQAIDLILSMLGKLAQCVALESPTYANVIPLMRFHRLKLMEIPMGNDGMDLNYLSQQIKKKPPLFVYTIPNFQNPTGITTTQTHREDLLSICEKHKIPLVEDGFEEEMKYFGKVVLPIKSMDRNQVVIYLGTFSKVLFPGIRIGWIAADRDCIRRLSAIKRFTDLTGSNLLQAALSAFLRNGYYDLHLKKMHRVFRKRMTVALKSLQEYMPHNVLWTKPDGGYTIWGTLENGYSNERDFKNVLFKNGVMVSPGLYYFFSSNNYNYFRISISSLNEQEISQGIFRLGQALREFNGQKKL
jgi:DNA-binding transcriptional MocR family regulator